MAERILEIKSLILQLSSLLEGELNAQRNEIEQLKRRIEELEKREVQVVVQEPEIEVDPIQEDEPHFEVQDLSEEIVRTPTKGPETITSLADLFAHRNTLADAAQNSRCSWMIDIPGPKVNTIFEALSLNDRLTFIREMFDGDSEQFNITLERIDETSSFEEVVSDMRSAYPEWDENSDIVYRFYMIVRRKFR